LIVSILTLLSSSEKVNQQIFWQAIVSCFKRGELWTEQLEVTDYSETSSGFITFGAYLQTRIDKPIISTIVEQSHIWLNQGGNI
jgi:hypothetical protein